MKRATGNQNSTQNIMTKTSNTKKIQVFRITRNHKLTIHTEWKPRSFRSRFFFQLDFSKVDFRYDFENFEVPVLESHKMESITKCLKNRSKIFEKGKIPVELGLLFLVIKTYSWPATESAKSSYSTPQIFASHHRRNRNS